MVRVHVSAAVCTRVWLLMSIAAMSCGGDDTECPTGTMPVGEGCVEIPDATPVADGRVDDARVDTGGDADLTCVPSDEPDDLDTEGRDTDCDGVDGVASELVFVSAMVGNDSNAGTPDAPVATLARALEVAGDRTVVADAGPFAESLSLVGSARIHGGYALVEGRWIRGSARTRVMSSDALWTFAEGDAGRLVDVDVEGANATMGQSAYGLRVVGPGELALTRVTIRAGDGGPGADGGSGEPGAAGDLGTDGLECHPSLGCASPVPATPFMALTRCSPRGGSGGGSGQPGTAGERQRNVPGGGAGGGGAPTGSPTSGGPGDPGPGGIDGASGAVGVFERGGYEPQIALDGTNGTPGEGGGGGGGGGGGTSVRCAPADASVVGHGASGGSGGGGGCGGSAGTGGLGGRASVALWVEDARVAFEDVTLITGDGGLGGAGGSGGSEGSGGTPGMGGAWRCSQAGSRTQAGAPGGRGGAGGRGGHGGGGAGGPSVGLVVLGGEVTGTPELELGAGGFGGSSEGNRGPRGERVERVER